LQRVGPFLLPYYCCHRDDGVAGDDQSCELSCSLRLFSQVKAGDVIVKVGSVNIQNQPLSNLRDLILGEPGTYVVLGFNRGSQFVEARMMRGTPDFLDKHMSAPTQPTQSMQQQAPAPSPSRAQAPAPAPARAQAPAPTTPLPSGGGGGSSREKEEFERMRAALSASQAEVARLRANLREQELQNGRNGEELRTYREALEKRDEENSSSRTAEDRNRTAALQTFKQRFDQERWRLGQALEKSQAASRSLAQVVPNIQALQQQYR